MYSAACTTSTVHVRYPETLYTTRSRSSGLQAPTNQQFIIGSQAISLCDTQCYMTLGFALPTSEQS